MPWKTLTLNDGTKIPQIAFGSAGHSLQDTPDVIDTAIDVGFSHIDTAQSASPFLCSPCSFSSSWTLKAEGSKAEAVVVAEMGWERTDSSVSQRSRSRKGDQAIRPPALRTLPHYQVERMGTDQAVYPGESRKASCRACGPVSDP